MKTELYNYDVYPKVFPAGKEVTVTIQPLGEHATLRHVIAQAKSTGGVCLAVFGLGDGNPRDYPERGNGQVVPFTDDGRFIRFTHTFPAEQRYFLRFIDRDTGKTLVQLSVFAVDGDLCGRYPLIGDLHMHTCRSDGRQAPAIVCADYRKLGYDFMVISDHRRYYPSLEAIRAYEGAPIGLTIVPGEEVHMPKSPGCINDVHIVNFGGNYSVNALVPGDHLNEVGDDPALRSYQGFPCPDTMTEDAFRREVLALADTLDIPEGIEPFAYACCVWVFNHIRRGQGLGVFAHPYWISNVYQVPDSFTDYMLKTHPFDAFEVLGGESYYEQNGFQAQKYYELRARGVDFPIVGSTDSHSSVNNPNGRVAATMVFSPERDKDAIIRSIKESYSVAIDKISAEYRLVGDFRLSRYAWFLLEDFFPLHDDLCYEEGRAMKDYACGVEGAKETLEFLAGRTERQLKKYFAFQ